MSDDPVRDHLSNFENEFLNFKDFLKLQMNEIKKEKKEL